MTSLKPQINHDKLAREVMANPVKIETSPYHTNFEDFSLETPEGSESRKLLNIIDENVASTMGLKLDGFWSHLDHLVTKNLSAGVRISISGNLL